MSIIVIDHESVKNSGPRRRRRFADFSPTEFRPGAFSAGYPGDFSRVFSPDA
jgi:hypothetical protein